MPDKPVTYYAAEVITAMEQYSYWLKRLSNVA